MIIKNGLTYDKTGAWRRQNLTIEENRIQAIVSADTKDKTADEADGRTVLDADGCYVVPGLIDLHFHGCGGFDFCDGTEEALSAIAAYELSQGVTTIAPASMTLDAGTLTGIFKNAAAFHKMQEEKGSVSDASMARLAGINMEGPYVSMAKKGAQNGAYIHKPDIGHFRAMQEAAGGLIRLTTLAPEEPYAMDFIKELKDEVIISLGHTTADYETAERAFSAGASHVTHLFNAMPPFSHREPGLIGAAFDHKNVMLELICDGVHIAPAAVRAAFAMFGAERMILISDSMMAAGLEDGAYALGGQKVNVRGNLATLESGTIAGSVTNLMKCVQTAISFGIPAATAIRCASENPAKRLGIFDECGSLDAGKFADVLVLDRNYQPKHIIHRGILVK